MITNYAIHINIIKYDFSSGQLHYVVLSIHKWYTRRFSRTMYNLHNVFDKCFWIIILLTRWKQTMTFKTMTVISPLISGPGILNIVMITFMYIAILQYSLVWFACVSLKVGQHEFRGSRWYWPGSGDFIFGSPEEIKAWQPYDIDYSLVFWLRRTTQTQIQ